MLTGTSQTNLDHGFFPIGYGSESGTDNVVSWSLREQQHVDGGTMASGFDEGLFAELSLRFRRELSLHFVVWAPYHPYAGNIATVWEWPLVSVSGKGALIKQKFRKSFTTQRAGQCALVRTGSIQVFFRMFQHHEPDVVHLWVTSVFQVSPLCAPAVFFARAPAMSSVAYAE